MKKLLDIVIKYEAFIVGFLTLIAIAVAFYAVILIFSGKCLER